MSLLLSYLRGGLRCFAAGLPAGLLAALLCAGCVTHSTPTLPPRPSAPADDSAAMQDRAGAPAAQENHGSNATARSETAASPATGDNTPLLDRTAAADRQEKNADMRAKSAARELSMAAAVDMALRRNPALSSGMAQTQSSEAGRRSRLGQFGPAVALNYTARKQELESSPRPSSPAADMGNYSWAVGITQSVFTGFRLLSEYQQAALRVESDKASLRMAELAMTGEVQTAFLAYLRAKENCRSEQDALARLRDQLHSAQVFHQVGLRPRIEVLQAEVNVSQAENRLIQAENTRDIALAKLNSLLVLPRGNAFTYKGGLDCPHFPRDLDTCLAQAERGRPDLFIAQKSVETAKQQETAARADAYPQVNAYYNMNQAGNTPDFKRSGYGGSESVQQEAGIQMNWNVFQWGTTYYAGQQAAMQVSRLRYEQEKLRLDVQYEVESRLLSVKDAEKRISVAQKGVEQAQEAYDVAQARYKEQVGTSLDVLDASSSLTTAQAAVTAARADYLTALAQLYVSIGEFNPSLSGRQGAAERR